MTHWFLIVILFVYRGDTVLIQPFQTQTACEAAKTFIIKSLPYQFVENGEQIPVCIEDKNRE